MRHDRVMTSDCPDAETPVAGTPPDTPPAVALVPVPKAPVALYLAAVFLLELVAFAALAYGSWRLVDGPLRLAAVFAVPAVAIVAWGLFVSPKARILLPVAGRLAIELAVYGAAVTLLLVSGAVAAGVILTVLVGARQTVRFVAHRRAATVSR
ncbi:MAG: DUF2568 domain-containing protein [Streptosporangiales bacterium]|nr:DUF2568 domain-containing protein [Streptosporangiales bacterium]